MQPRDGLLLALPFAIVASLLAPQLASAEAVIHDLGVISDTRLVVGAPSTVVASVTASRDLNDSRGVGGARVTLDLVAIDGKGRSAGALHRLGVATTKRDGRAVIEFLPPRVASAHVGLRVTTDAAHGARVVVRHVTIEENAVLHLRTDRGVYRPGTSMRWRVTAVHGINSHPIANASVAVEIRNPDAAPIWRGSVRTDAGGMISGAVPLANDAPTGQYTIVASAADRSVTTSESVVVRPIVLPPFIVSIDATPSDPRPGEKVTATVTARYPHGEPVSGEFSVDANVDGLELARREGKLDRFGKMSFSVTPPIGERGVISATVVDGAGRSRSAAHPFDLPGARLRMALIPESHRLAPGLRRVHVITTDGRGNLIPASVRLEWTGAEKRRTVQSPGVVVIPIDVRVGLGELRLLGSATADDGRVAVFEQVVDVDDSTAATMTVAEPVVVAGRRIDVHASWPERDGPVVATLIRHGAPIASSVVRFSAADSNRGTATLSPPVGSFGLATVRLTEMRFDRRTGVLRPRSLNHIVYLRRRRLDVAIESRVRHAPGEMAKARILVTHLDGAPALGVRIAASVVDERVLALSKPRPDLAHVLDELGSTSPMVRRGAAEGAGLVFADLLRSADRPVATAAMVALLATLPSETAVARVSLSEAERVTAEAARIAEADDAIGKHMFATPASLGTRVGATPVKWVFAIPMDDVLGAAGWTAERRLDPWKRPTTWRFAHQLVPGLTFARQAGAVVDRRLDALVSVLRKRRAIKKWLGNKRVPASLDELRYVPAHLRVDPWGTPIAVSLEGQVVTLRSAGPDQEFNTKDDETREQGSTGYGTGYGSGSAYGGLLGGRAGQVPQVRIGNARLTGGIEADVRKRFDETVLWETGIATDSTGVATIDVPLADSVTGWQLDIEAVGPRGAVGVSRGRFETHLARYVDAAMPNGLSVGDSFRLPLVVANHTATSMTMALTIKARGAIEARGSLSPSDTVAARSTRAFGLDLRAVEPGEGVLEVTLSVDGVRVDVFERRLRVEHPGLLVRSAAGDAFDDGRGALSVEIDRAAEGTRRGRLRLFRGAVDRAIDGIDRLVREPHGCFEQTSSATYPNLLVIELLTGIGADAAAAPAGLVSRARRFVAQGYQRLISYEVEGGGFSWFGDAPANQVLTAYGLMEFVDMSRVYPVDDAMVKRTRKWLLGKQRRDGSWREGRGTLGGDSQLAATAYIAWALAESGYRGAALNRALAYLGARRVAIARDGYVLALWAAAEALVGGKPGVATRLLDKSLVASDKGLKVARRADAPSTIFYAGGDAADAQATALAAMALHRSGNRADARRALRWLGGRGSASWGRSTQGTVLALRAMTTAADRQPAARGVVAVTVNGKRAGSVDLASNDLSGVELDRFLRAGKNTIALEPGAGIVGLLSVALETSWREKAAAGASSAGLEVTRKLEATRVVRGTRIGASVTVTSTGKKTVEMPMVIVPIPPGFRAEHRSHRRHGYESGVKRAEDVGTELRFYLEDLDPGESLTIAYRLTAENVANVLHRPATAYAYYTPEVRGSSEAGRLEVTE